MVLSGSVTNSGTNALTATKLTATIYNTSNVVVQTYTGTPVALAVGATSTFTAGTWTPPATPADYTIKYVVSHANSATENNRLNDTIILPFSVTSDLMARDNGNRKGGLGLNAGTATAAVQVRQAQEFKINTAGTLTSVDVQIGGGGVGDTLQLEIYTVTAACLPAQSMGRC